MICAGKTAVTRCPRLLTGLRKMLQRRNFQGGGYARESVGATATSAQASDENNGSWKIMTTPLEIAPGREDIGGLANAVDA